MSQYFTKLIAQYPGWLQPVQIVTKILSECYRANDFSIPVYQLAMRYKISTRTLQRYFEATTSISTKQALQIMRVRKAAENLINFPMSFHYSQYGYYDYSHFYKHLKRFLQKATLQQIRPHLTLLEALHKE